MHFLPDDGEGWYADRDINLGQFDELNLVVQKF
jgi:hypothetical protein